MALKVFFNLALLGCFSLLTGCVGLSSYTQAASTGDTAAVSAYLAKGGEVDKKDELGTTALYQAAKAGREKLVALLLTAGAQVDSHNKDGGFTPLYMAAGRGHKIIVEQLLAAGADPSLKSTNGYSPLYAASYAGRHKVIERLLAAGAQDDTRNGIGGSTPLYEAASGGHTIIVEQLLAAGANPNLKTLNGLSPLYQASRNGHLKVVERLLAMGAQLDSRNGDNGTTPLYEAVKRGETDTVRILLAAGANPNVKTNSGYTALYEAARKKGSDDIIKMLLASDANPNLYIDDGKGYRRTPLYIAAYYDHFKTVELLLLGGADVNQGSAGTSALDVATYKRHNKTKAILVRHGARTNTTHAKKSNNGDMFGKILATVAIGAAAASANIPVENALDVMDATVKDIWTGDGQGNQLAKKQLSMMSGTYQISDPALRSLAQTRIEGEQRQRELAQKMAEIRARQEEQRRINIAADSQRQQALTARKKLYQQKQVQAAAQRQQAKQQQQRPQANRSPAGQATAANTQAQRPQQQAAVSRPAATTRVVPRARSGSIRQGRLNSSDKVDCDCDGQLTKRNFNVGSCKVESMTVTYKVSNFMDEPVVNGNYKWKAPAGAETDCLPPDFTLWLKIENADSYGYVAYPMPVNTPSLVAPAAQTGTNLSAVSMAGQRPAASMPNRPRLYTWLVGWWTSSLPTNNLRGS